MCAGVAGQRGRKVLLLDHAERVAEKIRISGGGRCNFTNRDAGPAHFVSGNPHFCKSALARYTAQDFIALVQRHRIAFHEKHKGQLFCDDSSEQIIALLLRECAQGNVTHRQPCAVQAVRRVQQGAGEFFELDTAQGTVQAARLVVATGGLSIPKIGATDFGYRLARQFGLKIVDTRPALAPLTFDAAQWQPFAALSGLSLEVDIHAGGPRGARFREDLLFTHRGLSGPAVLQASTYWRAGEPLRIDLAPQLSRDALRDLKRGTRKTVAGALAELLPERLAHAFAAAQSLDGTQRLADLPDRTLDALHATLTHWQVTPSGSEGYRKAEVTAGGVSTDELSSTTMEARKVAGLHFIGEVVDVTGWLGGYNFQWAWSSAQACAMAL
ncbi:MAG: NAD(P)/FAD-dependent oxidoreductase [Betaproteobacteria bacterium]|nr:NAD(P)/FAD-dependent oxidoreductase [Betaproteobacteria bacterium]